MCIAQIGLEISYATAFDGSTLPQTLTNLVYERAAVLYNLAALYSQLGSAEDRSTPQGLKQAIKFYQVCIYPSCVLADYDLYSPSIRMPLEPSITCMTQSCRSYTHHWVRRILQ